MNRSYILSLGQDEGSLLSSDLCGYSSHDSLVNHCSDLIKDLRLDLKQFPDKRAEHSAVLSLALLFKGLRQPINTLIT